MKARRLKTNQKVSSLEGDFRGFITRIVCLNSPTGTLYTERRSIIDMVELILQRSPCLEYMTLQEVSRVAARITYQEWKNAGWRKKKTGKRVCWSRDRQLNLDAI